MTSVRPARGPAMRLPTWTMTREALTVGFNVGDRFLGRTRGRDITRFRCANRRFVVLNHPHYVDHVLHRARAKYVKSNDYEAIRVAAGLNLLNDEGDSWAAHRTTLNPTFARRHLSEIVDLIIDPIERIAREIAARGDVIEFDMHETMVEATLRVVANALFSQDFGPLVHSMHDLATEGLRQADKFQRLTACGLMPRRAWAGLTWCAYSRLPMPPPLRRPQKIARALDAAVNRVLDERLAHPAESADLLNVLLNADNGTWPRRRVRDEALTFIIAGHETTANSLSWFWYLLALNARARDRMLDEVDTVLARRRPTAEDLSRLPWTTACIQEAQRYFSSVWTLGREAIEDDDIDGHRIRTGTTVIVPIHHIHHDPRWWPNPEQFDPTRFMPGADGERPRSAYLPFGGGRRSCIGQTFALMEMVLMASIMSQRFVFDLRPGLPVELEATLTLRPRHGLHVVGRKRSLQPR